MTPFGASSALAPAGPHAHAAATLWWVLFALALVVYLAVVAVLFLGVSRRPRTPSSRGQTRAVIAGGVVTGVVLLTILGASVRAGHGMHPPAETAGLTVKVIGHQWWWEIIYPGSPESETVTTANELHLPVGTTVLVQLVSRDVIHSLWIPSLHGKRDLIPGHDSTTFLRADRPGTFHGQCAEFCGVAHARMSLLVVAEPPDDFQRWLVAQRQTPPPPTGASALRGRALFMRGTCAGCHTVLGTEAGGAMGPDLTHFASRLTLGSASRPRDDDHLRQWIFDPSATKPGVHMPGHAFTPAELDDLVSYLGALP